MHLKATFCYHLFPGSNILEVGNYHAIMTSKLLKFYLIKTKRIFFSLLKVSLKYYCLWTSVDVKVGINCNKTEWWRMCRQNVEGKAQTKYQLFKGKKHLNQYILAYDCKKCVKESLLLMLFTAEHFYFVEIIHCE